MEAPAPKPNDKIQKQIADVIVRLFVDKVHTADRALDEVLRLSANYAIRFGNEPGIFIVHESLIRAVIGLGFYREKTVANWLVDAMAARRIIDKQRILETQRSAEELVEIEAAWLRGEQPQLYKPLLETTIRDAMIIAKFTSKGAQGAFGLRELIMALLHAVPAGWLAAGVSDIANYAQELRSDFVRAIVSNPNPGQIDVWRMLVMNSPAQVEAQLRSDQQKRPAKSSPSSTQPRKKQAPARSSEKVVASVRAAAKELEIGLGRESTISPEAQMPQSQVLQSQQLVSETLGSSIPDDQTSETPNDQQPPTKAGPPESLPVHTDDPSLIDQLGRKGFARVLAQRIIEARKLTRDDAKALENGESDPADQNEGNRAFIVHLHGPWGAGKSTVLNFVRDALHEAKPKPWLVVEFNAWRAQRLKPEWWSVILHVQRAALKAEPNLWRKWWFGLRWHLMRLKADIMPALVGLGLMGIAALMLGWAVLGSTDEPLKGLAALISGIGGVYAFGRSLLSGSNAAAQSYTQLRGDPYGPMMSLFCELVRAVGRPVIVFVDDLDRCDREYVCNLLESIQTMLRAAPITYLIAADRKWICTSFERRYADFADHAVDSGRPLGYQFLDKLFQISANLPAIPVSLRDTYWNSLLQRADDPAPVPDMEMVEAQAAEIVQSGNNWEEYGAIADHVSENPVLQQAVRAEIAKQVSSAEKVEATQHRLLPLGGLVENNPRSMKRLANAVGMSQARLVLEGRTGIELEAIARWTIIELRWPLLADWLVDDPMRISAKSKMPGDDAHDQVMSKLLASDDVKAVIGGARSQGKLTSDTLSALIA